MSIIQRKHPEKRLRNAAIAMTAFAALSIAPACEQPSSCEQKVVTGNTVGTMKQGKCNVRSGDSLVKLEFQQEKSGFFNVSVGEISKQGVEINVHLEIFMSETATNKANPLIVPYGETVTFQNLQLTSQKGKTPGTAILDIQYLENPMI